MNEEIEKWLTCEIEKLVNCETEKWIKYYIEVLSSEP
jgi:hypothetical protein